MGTEMSVTEVAYAAGFSDSSYFIPVSYTHLTLPTIA